MISPTSSPSSVTTTSSAFASFVLRHLHVAGLRARIIANEINNAGVALKSGLIDTETALAMLGEAGLHLTDPSSGAA